jgi:anti-sigma factor ChrR (cupin superfamily)
MRERSDPNLTPLLHALPPAAPPALLRRRLFERVGASAACARAMVTQRHVDTVPLAVAAGITLRPLYRGAAGARRAGEPDAVTLVEFAPGAGWSGLAEGDASAQRQREIFVLRGSVTLGDTTLHAHDYHVLPAGFESGVWHSDAGALLHHREAQPLAGAHTQAPTQAHTQAHTQRAAQAPWHEYGPGIQRRVMWQQGGQAAMLYDAQPGASVPQHDHGHDEECLMLRGDFFLDEVLLRALDYQLAPAGSGHRISSTDTGVLLYAHGDVQLALR